MKILAAILMLTAAAAVGAAMIFLPDEVAELKTQAKKVVRKGLNKV